MATKFLKAQNGGIYKDSNGKLVVVEPERVIRDIDGNIPASTLEDISVSTGTASTNGVTYIRATMKGEVTYTDNTHDTVNYYIDLPIKAGDGVTIKAQPIEGATGNKQLVISASGGGGGGATLNKYTFTLNAIQNKNANAERQRLYNICQNAKGKVQILETSDPNMPCMWGFNANGDLIISGFKSTSSSSHNISGITSQIHSDGACEITYSTSGTTRYLLDGTYDMIITYWNDTEITA